MPGKGAAQIEPVATLHAVDRNRHAIDLAAAWPLIDRVLREWQPLRIQLFGSRARGDANRESDWDFLVVVPDASPASNDPLAGKNRYAIYHYEQAAEKVIKAVLTSEGVHANIRHHAGRAEALPLAGRARRDRVSHGGQ